MSNNDNFDYETHYTGFNISGSDRAIETMEDKARGNAWLANTERMEDVGRIGRILVGLGLLIFFLLCPPTLAVGWHGDISLWIPFLVFVVSFIVSTIGMLMGGTIKFRQGQI